MKPISPLRRIELRAMTSSPILLASNYLITVSLVIGINVRAATSDGEKYPQTGTRLITEEEAAAMTYAELRYAINEMYARHGADFPTQPAIAKRFRQFGWYHPKKGVSMSEIESEFTDTERANVQVLAKYREQKKTGGSDKAAQVSLAAFVGTWRQTWQESFPNGVRVTKQHTLVISPDMASVTRHRTYEFVGKGLLQGKPAIFESYPRFSIETRHFSRELDVQGSVLRITWPAAPGNMVGCEPKEIAERLLKEGFIDDFERETTNHIRRGSDELILYHEGDDDGATFRRIQ